MKQSLSDSVTDLLFAGCVNRYFILHTTLYEGVFPQEQGEETSQYFLSPSRLLSYNSHVCFPNPVHYRHSQLRDFLVK